MCYVSVNHRFRDPPKHAKPFRVCGSTGSPELLVYVDNIVKEDFFEGFSVTEFHFHLLSHFLSPISKKTGANWGLSTAANHISWFRHGEALHFEQK